jgi:hypothetical protein
VDVVEVATDVEVFCRRSVQGGEAHAIDLRQRRRSQPPLQRARNARTVLVEPCRVQRQRRALGNLLGEGDVV